MINLVNLFKGNQVDINTFEKNLLFFVRNSKEKIVHTNIAYYFGISTQEAKKHLEDLANNGVLMLDSDDDGNLFYYMPNVPREHNEEALKSYFFNTPSSKNQTLTVNTTPVYSQNQRLCPYCMEPIRPNAKKCKHCGEIIDVTLLNGTEKKNFPHFFHLFFTVLTSGVWIIIWMLHYLFRDRNKYD